MQIKKIKLIQNTSSASLVLAQRCRGRIHFFCGRITYDRLEIPQSSKNTYKKNIDNHSIFQNCIDFQVKYKRKICSIGCHNIKGSITCTENFIEFVRAVFETSKHIFIYKNLHITIALLIVLG